MPPPRIKITVIKPVGVRVDGAAFAQDVTRLVRRTTIEGRRLMSRYPPQRLRKSGYRRTGTLKRSWSHRVSAGGSRVEGIVGSNSNIAPYNRFVQGQEQLPLFRRAGWKGVDELAEFLEDKAENGLQEIVDRFAR